jgi:hypothetical protein
MTCRNVTICEICSNETPFWDCSWRCSRGRWNKSPCGLRQAFCWYTKRWVPSAKNSMAYCWNCCSVCLLVASLTGFIWTSFMFPNFVIIYFFFNKGHWWVMIPKTAPTLPYILDSGSERKDLDSFYNLSKSCYFRCFKKFWRKVCGMFHTLCLGIEQWGQGCTEGLTVQNYPYMMTVIRLLAGIMKDITVLITR